MQYIFAASKLNKQLTMCRGVWGGGDWIAILTKTKVFEKYIKKSTLPTFMTFGKTKRANFILSIWKEKFKMSFSPCDLTHLA